ncbi:MAG: AEC family transporter [Chloroflexi bacterium]|nr:AEC family transporter [Chloroflexota bacterium]
MLALLNIFVDNMIPVLTIAAVGVVLRRRLHVDPAMISRMMFYVFAPALAFDAVYTSDISGGDFLRVYIGTLALMAAVGAIAFLVLRVLNCVGATYPVARHAQVNGGRHTMSPLQPAAEEAAATTCYSINRREFATALVATFVFNGANFGLSIVNFAFGEAALTYAVIIYIAGSTVAWTLGPYVSSSGAASMLKSLESVLRTPVVYALALALALKAAGILELPPALSRSSQLLADASIPLMLVLLGLQLGGFRKPDRWRLLLSGTAIRLLLAPLLAIVCASLLGLHGAARSAFILQAGMPTAVLTLILAYEFDTDRDLALNLIMTTTLLSPLSLTVLIYLLQNGVV